MTTLHALQGAWYANGVEVTANGDKCMQKGHPPQTLVPAERLLGGDKIITVARNINGEEVIVDPRKSNGDQIVWLNHKGEHCRVWMKR